MKQCIIYECETCGKQSKDKQEIIECECIHIGLTVAEKKTYDFLKEKVKHTGRVVSITKNEETDREFEKAIDRLLEFEKIHEI